MAKNDIVLLDGIIDHRLTEGYPSGDIGEVFEYFVLNEMLKNYDLSPEEIEHGWIDGRDDGGIDGFYTFVNGHLLTDIADFPWPRASGSLEIWLLTIKHHSTFLQAPLDTLNATVQELFDLSISNADLKGCYSEDLLLMRNLFAGAYRRLSMICPNLTFHVVYASRGDASVVGDSVAARSRQVIAGLSKLFSSSRASFHFMGAGELVELHRHVKTFSLHLPFIEHLASEHNSYVLLVRLVDYWQFVTEASGELRRYLFDSNVRDYIGNSSVNRDIAATLSDSSSPDFWWLNNGVTILATEATVPGKTIQMQNIQIVNGLQTTEAIYRHYAACATNNSDRSVLVKVIVSSDDRVRDCIIRATNNQNPVQVDSLHATDKIQKDIESILERNEWYYERRRNYYRNIGKPPIRVVTPAYLASAVVALVFKHPLKAINIDRKLMRNTDRYNAVYSESFPIEVWPRLVAIFKDVDKSIAQMRMPQRIGGRDIKTKKALIALMVVARRLGTYDYTVHQLLMLDIASPIRDDEVADAWDIVRHVQERYQKKLKSSFLVACCEESARRYSLRGVEVVCSRGISDPVSDRKNRPMITPLILEAVDGALPPQPWRVGVHREVAIMLGLPTQVVSSAIQHLIRQGRRQAQRGGVVYDQTKESE